jgi:hypothetical protein
MPLLDRLKTMLRGGGTAPGGDAGVAAAPAPEPRVQPGDEPVPAPVDTQPPHGDPARDIG